MNYKDWLNKAKDVLRERGWVKGSLETPDGRVCALGAVMHASDEFQVPKGSKGALQTWRVSTHLRDNHPKLFRALTEAAEEGILLRRSGVSLEGTNPVPLFNDDIAKDQDDVLKLFDAALCYLNKMEED